MEQKHEKRREDIRIMDLVWERIWFMLTGLHMPWRKEKGHLDHTWKASSTSSREQVKSWITTYQMQEQALRQWVKANRKAKGQCQCPQCQVTCLPTKGTKEETAQPGVKPLCSPAPGIPSPPLTGNYCRRKNTLYSDTLGRGWSKEKDPVTSAGARLHGPFSDPDSWLYSRGCPAGRNGGFASQGIPHTGRERGPGQLSADCSQPMSSEGSSSISCSQVPNSSPLSVHCTLVLLR